MNDNSDSSWAAKNCKKLNNQKNWKKIFKTKFVVFVFVILG